MSDELPLILLSVGQAIVLLGGGIDISVGGRDFLYDSAVASIFCLAR